MVVGRSGVSTRGNGRRKESSVPGVETKTKT